MINDNYLTLLAKLATGQAGSIPSYTAFGSTVMTLAANDVNCSGEFTRVAQAGNTNSGNIAKFIAVRLATSANNETFNNACAFDAAASGNILVDVLIPSLLQTTDFDVDMEFWVQHTRSP